MARVQAVTILKSSLGVLHPDYSEALNALVSAQYHLGNFAEVSRCSLGTHCVPRSQGAKS